MTLWTPGGVFGDREGQYRQEVENRLRRLEVPIWQSAAGNICYGWAPSPFLYIDVRDYMDDMTPRECADFVVGQLEDAVKGAAK